MSNKPRTANVESFLASNKIHPVVKGRAGGRYTLDNGEEFVLSRDEIETIGCPRFKG